MVSGKKAVLTGGIKTGIDDEQGVSQPQCLPEGCDKQGCVPTDVVDDKDEDTDGGGAVSRREELDQDREQHSEPHLRCVKKKSIVRVNP